MQKLRHFFIAVLLLSTHLAQSQKQELVANYIHTYKELAIAEMKRTGVPASITLAQGIHESGAGSSQLVQSSNNHFGIKCKSNWKGETVKHDDDARGECFRKYPLPEDSYKDHSDFLKNGPRYASLFLLDPTDYAGWANGLKQAGYATNPKYPQVLIKLIEEHGLQHYTFVAMGKIPDKAAEADYVSNNPAVSEPKTDISVVTTLPVNQPIYPPGLFKVNDTKVLFVKKGISFFSIAKQYDVDLSKIFEFNEIPRTEITDRDQLIYLQRKRKTGDIQFHIVQPGETMHSIAQLEAIRLESLQELNWLKDQDMPAIGEKLSLQSKSSSIPKLTVKENFSLVPVTGNKTSN